MWKEWQFKPLNFIQLRRALFQQFENCFGKFSLILCITISTASEFCREIWLNYFTIRRSDMVLRGWKQTPTPFILLSVEVVSRVTCFGTQFKMVCSTVWCFWHSIRQSFHAGSLLTCILKKYGICKMLLRPENFFDLSWKLFLQVTNNALHIRSWGFENIRI